MKKELILGIGLVSFLTLIINLSFLLADKFEVATCGCPKMVSQNFVGLFILLSFIFVSCLFYYLFSLKIEGKNRIIKSNIDVLYSILDDNEKNLLGKIILNNGFIEQSDISKEYGKIKSHRLVKKLEEKNIVFVIKNGKKNIIELKKELKQELVK